MALPAKEFYTPEEYLALEEAAETKSEYYDGEIFAMAGGSANHNQIAVNLIIALGSALRRKPCRVFSSDMRLLVRRTGLYTYPDVMVVCGQPEFVEGRNDTITNPILIVEVLSESTKHYDRGAKFELYRALETLQDYVLIDQDRVYIEYFHHLEDGDWRLRTHRRIEDTLTLHSVAVSMPLTDIYDKVDWTA